MAAPIEAQLILCDAAQADGGTGKVHMLGAGWSVTSSPTGPHAIVVLMKIPWDRANQKIPLRLDLLTQDGSAVQLATPNGQSAVSVPERVVEVGRPPGVAYGSVLDASFALNVGGMPLEPGRYCWRLELAELTISAVFTVRAN